MGFVTDAEAGEEWLGALKQLEGQSRVTRRDGRWFAVDGTADPKKILLGRLEALGPVTEADPRIAMAGAEQALLLELEHEGSILRTRLDGRAAWCERRLLARVHRYTLDRLRREIEPVSAAEFLQFLGCWQHLDEDYGVDGPAGLGRVLRQLAGFEAPAWAWESHILPRRVSGFKREWLDDITLSGEFAWGRLWGSAGSAVRVTPVTFVPRDDLDRWLALTEPPGTDGLSGPAADLLKPLAAQGAMFPQNLPKAANLVPAHVEMGLAELLARGFITCDSFGALRQMITPPSRRRSALRPVGRWSCLRTATPVAGSTAAAPVATSGLTAAATPGNDALHEMAARQLLSRTGVVFRRTILREKLPVSWAALTRVYRRMELRGEVRGGRFVAGFSGEQFALPEAVEMLRHLKRQPPRNPLSVVSADPLNFQGILTPDERVAPTTRRQVLVG
jgi:ATP-dependent Lhr-like helicase